MQSEVSKTTINKLSSLPKMKTLKTLIIIIFTLLNTSYFAQTIQFDESFSSDGIFYPDFGVVYSASSGRTVTFDNNSRIIAAGQAISSNNGQFAVTRITPTGTADVFFQTDGTYAYGNTNVTESITNCIFTDDIRLICQMSASTGFFILKTFASFTEVQTFGNSGQTSITAADAGYIAIDEDQNIYCLFDGLFNSPTSVRKFSANGQLDETFNSQPGLTFSERPFDIQVYNSNIYILTRRLNAIPPVNWRYVIRKIDLNGFIDNSWVSAELVADGLQGGISGKMTISPSGQILVATGEDSGIIRVNRLNSDGSFDPTFAQDGSLDVQITNFGDATVTSLSVRDDGGLVISGNFSSDGTPQSYILGLHADGTPDADFGPLGIFIPNFMMPNGINDSKIDAQGRLVATGFVIPDSFQEFMVARFTLNSTNVSEASNPKFQYYPNPVQNDLNISISNDALPAMLNVFTIDGRLMESINVTASRQTIALGHLSEGVYTIQIQSPQGISSSKFIKK